jgi:hypothetical protein
MPVTTERLRGSQASLLSIPGIPYKEGVGVCLCAAPTNHAVVYNDLVQVGPIRVQT